MKSKTAILIPLVLGMLGGAIAVVDAQMPPAQQAGPGIQAPADAREPVVLSLCRHRPPPRRSFRNFRLPPQGPFPYTVHAIPGVIAAGQRWKILWRFRGGDGDGIIPTADGGILVAQSDDSDVVKLSANGRASMAYRDTDTGGALSETSRGQLFIVERALLPSVWELSPKRRMLADQYHGEPLDCLGGVMDAPAALENGGVYFGLNGLYYASPKGVVKKYGRNVFPNDMVLSASEKVLYVFSRGKIYTFDVGQHGALSNQRLLAQIPGGRNDGGAIDSAGRLYVAGFAGVHVFAADGKYLGAIPAPFNLICAVFSGPDGRTLFAVGTQRKQGMPRPVGGEVIAIPMIAHGFSGHVN